MSASVLDANNADSQGVTYSLDSPATGQASANGYAGSDGASIVIPAQVSKDGNTYNVVSIDFWGALYGKTYSSFTVSSDNSFLATDSNGLIYQKIDNEFSIIWGGASAITNITIPESINGTAVTGVHDFAFFGNASLSAIQFDDNMKYIGSIAFQGVSSLTSVTFGTQPSLLTINDYAFFGTSITSFDIPASVTSVGNTIFGSSSVTSVTIPNSITSVNFLNNAANLTNVVLDQNNPNFVFNNGFLYRKLVDGLELAWVPMKLTNIAIPTQVGDANVVSFGDYALSNSGSTITSITIPVTVKSIGQNALNGCQMGSVTIPDAVTSIGSNAFYLCNQLTSVTIPDAVTSIGSGAFMQCSQLTSVTIGNAVTSIGEYAFFLCSQLTSVTISDAVTSIGNFAFILCSQLTSVTIGNAVASIGSGAFQGCSQLTSVTIPDAVTSIGDSAFFQCSQLTSVTIGNAVASIGNNAFYCQILANVYFLGPNVTTLYGDPAESHDFFTFGQFVQDRNAVPLVSAIDPAAVAYYVNGNAGWSTYSSANPPAGFSDIQTFVPEGSGSGGNTDTIDANNADSQGVTYSLDSPNAGEAAVSGYTGTGGAIVIPSTVTATDSAVYSVVQINNGALNGKSITSLSFPDTLRYIGYFSSCGNNLFTTLTIPSSVTFIGNSAFADCANLASIVCNTGSSATIDSSWVNRNTNLTSISLPNNANIVNGTNSDGSTDNLILYDLSKTPPDVFWMSNSKTSITIPESINGHVFTTLTNKFLPSNIKEIYFPSTMTTFADNACTSMTLTEFTIPSTVVNIGSSIFDLPWAEAANLTTLTINNALTDITQIWDLHNLSTCNIPEDHPNFVKDNSNGCIYNKKNGGTELELVWVPNIVVSLVIPSTLSNLPVKSIGNRAGYVSSCFASVTIADSVLSIGSSAFSSCPQLTLCTIGAHVNTIGDNAFYGCSLHSLNIPDSVTSIGGNAFGGQTMIDNLASLIIGNGITSIPDQMFSGYDSLKTVIIGANVQTIGWMAFYGCNQLSRVIFKCNYETTLNGNGYAIGYENLFKNARFQRTGTDSSTDPSAFATLYYAEGATGWSTITVSPSADNQYGYCNFPFQVPPVMLNTYAAGATVATGETLLVTEAVANLDTVSGNVIMAVGSTLSITTVSENAIVETAAGSTVTIASITSAIVKAAAGSTVTIDTADAAVVETVAGSVVAVASGTLTQVSGSGTVIKTGTGVLEIASTTPTVDYVVNDGEAKFASTVTAIGNVETADGAKATVQPAEGTTVTIASITVGGSDGSEATLNNSGLGDVFVDIADKEKKTLNVYGNPVYINNVISEGPKGDIYVGYDVDGSGRVAVSPGNLTYTNGGDYSYDGPTGVYSGSTLTFANGNVNLTNSDVTIDAGATLELNYAINNANELSIDSYTENSVKSLTLNGTLEININATLVAGTYTLLNYGTKSGSGSATIIYSGAPNADSFNVTGNLTASAYTITVSAQSAPPTTYTVGGTVSGLGQGKSAVLHIVYGSNETTEDLTVNSNGSFTFTTPALDNKTCSVSILTQPSGQTGTVTNGLFSVSGQNVTNILIAFTDDSTPEPTPSSNVCFPSKTPVMTNQGPVNIEDIDPAVHTIRNKKIVAITKTVAHDKNLVRIAKHALGKNYPEKTTFISQNHKVLCQGQMIKAKHLVDEVNGVTFVPYNGQVLYNVLLEEHEKMQVNNLIVETLHPEHKVAKLYRFLKNVDAAHHGKFISAFNKCDHEQRLLR